MTTIQNMRKKLSQLNLILPPTQQQEPFQPLIETLGLIMDRYKNRQITILARRLALILDEVNRLRGFP